ncbi:MAG: bifunctional methylenetetrahydrofolate dehydrogenase/methenyltetrahydrofolate cyclohydrolase FolD [Burkholderiales bacterium]|nr:bifunctional methylenetetrahydrofolate dehydrogenase/methenyltetrahydrofolate cyclohydrolase FolD [Burkholderiales bacterium]
MPATLLDGKLVAQRVVSGLRPRVEALKARGIQPRLAVVRVGDDPASQIYIRAKIRACEQAGVLGGELELAASAREADVLARLEELNADSAVHGVLVQLPMPKGIDPHRVAAHIDPDKDVDGLHAINLGRLLQGDARFRPCTPAGVLRLLDDYSIGLRGRHAVVVGRSEIVGKPMALLLLERDATVTVCHSKTADIAAVTRMAEVVVVAVGRPGMLKGDMIKPGAVVVDVGVNRLADGRLAGDAVWDDMCTRAGHVTPVPGGVGPMTVAMLIENTVQAAECAAAGASECPELGVRR